MNAIDLSTVPLSELEAHYELHRQGAAFTVFEHQYVITFASDGSVTWAPAQTETVARRSFYVEGVKPVIDRIIALVALVILFPLFAVIAIAVKLDSRGPAFYRASVVGQGGKQFHWIKFRSMHPEAEMSALKHDALERFVNSRADSHSNGASYKIVADPRVTRVGKVLRRFSLDELPELLAILAGNMSFVGPRPCLEQEYAHYEPWQRERLAAKPGLTGLWQIHRRKNHMPLDEVALLDIYYARNCSLLLDLSTMIRTIPVSLMGRNEP